jgi:hypothetical protein
MLLIINHILCDKVHNSSTNNLPLNLEFSWKNIIFTVASLFLNQLLDILFHPLFVVSNGKIMSHLGPQHLFLFEKCCKKKWPLFQRHHLSIYHILCDKVHNSSTSILLEKCYFLL